MNLITFALLRKSIIKESYTRIEDLKCLKLTKVNDICFFKNQALEGIVKKHSGFLVSGTCTMPDLKSHKTLELLEQEDLKKPKVYKVNNSSGFKKKGLLEFKDLSFLRISIK